MTPAVWLLLAVTLYFAGVFWVRREMRLELELLPELWDEDPRQLALYEATICTLWPIAFPVLWVMQLWVSR